MRAAGLVATALLGGALTAIVPSTTRAQVSSSIGTPVLSARRVPGILAQAVADRRLAARLDRLLARDNACLIVRHGGRDLYARRTTEMLMPASNLKLLTASAALAALGPDHRFVTETRAGAPVVGGIIEGPLWIVGGGDPLLRTADYIATLRNQPPLRTPFEALVQSLVDAGITEVRGGVIGDESRYDTTRYIPTWKRRYIADGEVGPQSALILNDGFTAYRPRKVAASSPPTHAASALTVSLRERGVSVGAPPSTGLAPSGSVLIASVSSPPLTAVVGEMLRESDNTIAEMVVKELGVRVSGEGTTAAGLVAMRAALSRSGLPADQFATVDGSGLDRSDRATCHLLLSALEAAGLQSAVADGLPIAGRTGTLRKRFVGHVAAGRLRAKTGAIEGVVSLTGWLPVMGAEALSFSMIANGLPNEAAGRALQERVGREFVSFPEAPPADLLSP